MTLGVVCLFVVNNLSILWEISPHLPASSTPQSFSSLLLHQLLALTHDSLGIRHINLRPLSSKSRWLLLWLNCRAIQITHIIGLIPRVYVGLPRLIHTFVVSTRSLMPFLLSVFHDVAGGDSLVQRYSWGSLATCTCFTQVSPEMIVFVSCLRTQSRYSQSLLQVEISVAWRHIAPNTLHISKIGSTNTFMVMMVLILILFYRTILICFKRSRSYGIWPNRILLLHEMVILLYYVSLAAAFANGTPALTGCSEASRLTGGYFWAIVWAGGGACGGLG